MVTFFPVISKTFPENHRGTDSQKKTVHEKRAILQPDNPQILPDNHPQPKIHIKRAWSS